MHSHRAAFSPFREVTRSLRTLSEAQQFLRLEFELLHALERASDVQSRSRALEVERHRRKAQTPMRGQQAEVPCAELDRRRTDTPRPLVRSKSDAKEQLSAMRLEVLAMQIQCEALDEVCGALLITMERAARTELGAATEPGRKVRVSP
jgi:hypothetical protein